MLVSVTVMRKGVKGDAERPPRWPQAYWLRAARRFFAALIVLALSHSGVWGAERSARVQVDYTAPTISVEATHVSVQDVLVAVGDQVGFQVVMMGDLNAPVFNFSVHKASIEAVLDTLLGGRNYGVSYHTALGPSGHGIDKVFVLGAPESEGVVTSRVVTMDGHYPISTQDFPSSLTALLPRHQDIFNQWRENEGLKAQKEQTQEDMLQWEDSVVRHHQKEVEKVRTLFDTRGKAKEIQDVNGGGATPSAFINSKSALDQELESFHNVLKAISKQLEK